MIKLGLHMAQAQTVAPSPTLIIYFNSLDLT